MSYISSNETWETIKFYWLWRLPSHCDRKTISSLLRDFLEPTWDSSLLDFWYNFDENAQYYSLFYINWQLQWWTKKSKHIFLCLFKNILAIFFLWKRRENLEFVYIFRKWVPIAIIVFMTVTTNLWNMVTFFVLPVRLINWLQHVSIHHVEHFEKRVVILIMSTLLLVIAVLLINSLHFWLNWLLYVMGAILKQGSN